VERVSRLFTSCWSKPSSRSPGTSISIGPWSLFSVFVVVPLANSVCPDRACRSSRECPAGRPRTRAVSSSLRSAASRSSLLAVGGRSPRSLEWTEGAAPSGWMG
jgi:hypothetical protein